MSDLITPAARLLAPAGLPREEWLAVRRQGIGGSDVAAILGMDRYRGPLHVYQDKRGELAEQRSARLDRAARRGHRLEGLVAELFTEETGLSVVKSPGTFQNTERAHMLVNLDRIVIDARPVRDLLDGGVLECKSRTWRAARRENWGGDEPPDGPAIQAYWGMAVTGYHKGWVAGLVDDDFVRFELAYDEELIGHLTAIVDRFWHEHVVPGVPPEPGDLEATDELLGRMWDVAADSIKLFTPEEAAEADALLSSRKNILGRREEAERALAEIENALKLRLGDAEIAIAPGRELYSWKRNGNFASKRFREAEPELAAEYIHLVPAVDRERLAAEKPDIYRAHRARVFRTPGGSS
ncbi:endonuclease [Sphaerisporangium siamense]|uniref:Putative phage-type endonuclease n=1 Tax=Sphaerisporangium siamense TaxID=795645 RepID=A0A7W7GBK3_9ACTN|nr:YqaJ viral recombinase family protein [Sphaerisporangium siamense]MBB4702519.1 putative phage-type endonuclease [Sphaerisporangium siamense]GII88218.1 endonuclease [Sphaerisporangium siamense]